MDEANNNEWVCPVCETVNTNNVCVICGAKMQLQNSIAQTSNLEKQEESTTDEHSVNVSAEDSQWEADKWKRFVAIIILAINILAVVFSSLMEGLNHSEYIENTDYEEIIFIDDVNNRLNIVNVEISGAYNDDFGLNNYGEFVNWIIEIQIDDDIETVSFVQSSWDDNISCINDSTYIGAEHDDYGWQSVLQGNTHWQSYTNYDNDHFIDITLPDDFSIAGEQYLIINGVKISFNLEYLGSYSTGNGWGISDIIITLSEE